MDSKKPKVFVSQVLSDQTSTPRKIITNVASILGVDLIFADSRQMGAHNTKSIEGGILSASLVIVDITDRNLNALYEAGLAAGLNKPTIFISSSFSKIPFDVSAYRVLIYNVADDLIEFENELAQAISEALREPSTYSPKQVLEDRKRKDNLFISYSHRDTSFLDRLLVQLKPLERENRIEVWSDKRLSAGDRWKDEIEQALNRSNVAVLLVSADFLASKFIVENELPPILKKAESKGTRIIPLILKPCRFTRDGNLQHFQSINDPAKPMILLNEGEQEFVYDKVAEEVEKSIR